MKPESDIMEDMKMAELAADNQAIAQDLLKRLKPQLLKVVNMNRFRYCELDELIQLCQIEVFNSLRNYRGEGSLESWASQIAFRTAGKEKERMEKKHKLFLSTVIPDIPFDETPEHEFIKSDMRYKVVAEIEKMPQKRKKALMLHVFDGYTVREVARMSNVSENTIKARLKAAYRDLRAIIQKKRTLNDAFISRR
ncbi:MAG: sigma-70 family RNA polymerase sigma factor [Myxococcota bacterium]|nr:sigma-70 family RNA polymerase sigma factor [Myxococcota bacterium]